MARRRVMSLAALSSAIGSRPPGAANAGAHKAGAKQGALIDEPQPPRTFADLVGAVELGDQYYVQVIRKEPKLFNGQRVDGIQKPIRKRMNEEEFARVYGALSYELTLYGPPRSGAFCDAEGKPIYRARTKPIFVTVPGLSPNARMCIGYDDSCDEFPAEVPLRQRSSIATNADARIHESDLEHERSLQNRRVERERQREAEARQREELAQQRDAETIKQEARLRQQREREFEIERAARDRVLLDAIDALCALRRKI